MVLFCRTLWAYDNFIYFVRAICDMGLAVLGGALGSSEGIKSGLANCLGWLENVPGVSAKSACASPPGGSYLDKPQRAEPGAMPGG